MDKDLISKLIDEITAEVVDKNKSALEEDGTIPQTVEQTVRLSALTTIKILEKLELIDKG
ncbi:hypothetical protein KIH86_16505 [Paenibacillus sp. HN-1]|uniref:hypothetical protein n=1 Tax=Paenibacillus TaxID=44249 RepID=UPI001CA87EF2|nr:MULTISPECIES: hypothetical protein [Paenibacillus]MBY9082034.1 hypothetical protein [Paenibacillus sp. CGMCC 1.18879]MBY9085808.1 hypothetical protein [Paenibacillus sinensis]